MTQSKKGKDWNIFYPEPHIEVCVPPSTRERLSMKPVDARKLRDRLTEALDALAVDLDSPT